MVSSTLEQKRVLSTRNNTDTFVMVEINTSVGSDSSHAKDQDASTVVVVASKNIIWKGRSGWEPQKMGVEEHLDREAGARAGGCLLATA